MTSGREVMLDYGMREVARVALPERTSFRVTLTDGSAGAWTCSVYAFVIGDEICRIGSSKGPLAKRLAAWQRDLSARLANMEAVAKMATRAEEAALWRQRLELCGNGVVLARPGTMVRTPIGEISAYLDEESVLIGRHRPKLNNSMHR